MEKQFFESLQNHFEQTLVEEISLSLEKEPTHCLLLNERKISKEAFLSSYPLLKPHPFISSAFYYDKSVYDFGKSIEQASGAIYIQDAAAMMVAYLLNDGKVGNIIDLCASPGGKTIDMALLGDSNSLLLTNDISTPRAKELSGNIERMGMDNTIVTNLDPSNLASFYGESFDKVILDAPCSGSAMFRKNDLAKSDWSLEKVNSCAKLQRKLLEDAYALLLPGGTLAYSTCSFSKEENEDNVSAFLSAHEDMEILPLLESDSFYRPSSLKEAIYLLPNRFEGEGQFVAIMRKKPLSEYSQKPSKKCKFEKKTFELSGILKKYDLEKRFVITHSNSYYCLRKEFPLPSFGVLRPGLKLFEIAKDILPDHALSHALSSDESIAIDEACALAYLRGETFPIKEKKGFAIVSYQGLNLGFVKIVNGTAKNHYPKGLRQKVIAIR